MNWKGFFKLHISKTLIFVLLLITFYMIFIALPVYAVVASCEVYVNEKSNECGSYCRGDVIYVGDSPTFGWKALPDEECIKVINSSCGKFGGDVSNVKTLCNNLGYKFVKNVPTLKDTSNKLMTTVPIQALIIGILWWILRKKYTKISKLILISGFVILVIEILFLLLFGLF